MIRACIFDLDGVIVDTAKYHYLAWKRLANEMGFDFTEHDNERLKGVSRMRSLDILLEIGGKTLSDAEKQARAAQKNEWYVDYITRMTPEEVLPGVIPFLDALRAEGIRIALGSASKNAGIILDKVLLTHYFDAIIDGNKVSEAKPDPEVFLKAAEALGASPAECIVFEDAEAGIEAALRGGMRCVGLGSPDVLGKAHLVLSDLNGLTLARLEQL